MPKAKSRTTQKARAGDDARKPRATKTAKVAAMLRRPAGASLAAICKATGWQPHSARAALSGLRKAGHAIERTSAEGKSGTSIYRIIPPETAAEAPA